MTTKDLGRRGEDAVNNYLLKLGYTIIARNYRRKCGEIDLIACKGDLISFVEIKTRATCHFPLLHLITSAKQKKIIQTAKLFVLQNSIHDKTLRFDVATVIYTSAQSYTIEYVTNAFNEQSAAVI